MGKIKFNLKSGELSGYGLSCGYVEKKKIRENPLGYIEVELFHDGCYHVKAYLWKYVEPYTGCCGVETNLELVDKKWLTFDNLTETRQAYRSFKW